MNGLTIIGMLGGLGLFLFGIQTMGSGLQKMAGNSLQRILEVLTSKPIIGIFTGILVTILVQSSSVATVMLIGFVNAGLMNLSQVVGAIMGANIGTTITAQIISFDLDLLSLPAISLGALLNFFGRREFTHYLGQAILGFGLLFLGMVTMSEAMLALQESPFFLEMLVRFSENPLLGVLISALFTTALQSSTGATGIIIALTLQDLVTLEAAIPLILGTNIGSSVTVLLAGLGTSLSARRAAMAHILFNLLGVGVFLAIIGPFTELVLLTGETVARQTANAHTIFNIMNTALIFPFFNYFVRFLEFVMPGEETNIDLSPKYLEKRLLKTPAAAINATRQELLRMANVAREMVQESIKVFYYGDREKINQVNQKEDLIDELEIEINVYLQKIPNQTTTFQQTVTVSGLMSAANDLERIGDHSQNIVELAEKMLDERIQILDSTKQEVYDLYEKVDEMLKKAIVSFTEENRELAKEVVKMDNDVDEMEKKIRQRHFDEVNQQEYQLGSGMIYLDILSNLERVADHATNLAEVVLGNT